MPALNLAFATLDFNIFIRISVYNCIYVILKKVLGLNKISLWYE